jgi:hypothetical protein
VLDSWTNKANPSLSPYQPDPNNQASVVLNGLNGLSVMEFAGGGQTYDIVDTALTKTKINAQTFFWVLKEDNINEAHFFLGDADDTPFHRGVDSAANFAPDGKIWDEIFSSQDVRNGQTYLDGTAIEEQLKFSL